MIAASLDFRCSIDFEWFQPYTQGNLMQGVVEGITSKKVNYILDADIRGFFDEVNRWWLTRFLEHRIGDPRILHLIQKWLKAGILEDGAACPAIWKAAWQRPISSCPQPEALQPSPPHRELSPQRRDREREAHHETSAPEIPVAGVGCDLRCAARLRKHPADRLNTL
jgi:hypothetical protein